MKFRIIETGQTITPAEARAMFPNTMSNWITGVSAEFLAAHGLALVPTESASKAARQEAVWTRIKADRDQRMSGGVRVGEHWFHTDVDSRIKYLGLKDKGRDAIAAGLPPVTVLQVLASDIAWRSMGGPMVPMTAQLAFDVVGAVEVLDATLFAAGEQHRAAMMTVENPSAYDFSANWPARYVA